MNTTPAQRILILALLLGVAGFGAYRMGGRSSSAPSPDGLLPGAAVSVQLGRAAIAVDGDQADPLEAWSAQQAGKALPGECWTADRRWRALAYLDPESDAPVELKIRTRHRETSRTLRLEGSRAGLLLHTLDLELPQHFLPGEVPETALAFSPDGRRLAVASASGELKLLPVGPSEDPSPPQALEQRVREGMIKSLAFCARGEVLVTGEQSPDGLVSGFEVRDGHRLWSLRLADDLETSAPSGNDAYSVYSLPGAYRILDLPEGDALVLGLHSWRNQEGVPVARSRLYRIEARSGAVRWRFPASGPLQDRNLTWVDASADGRRVVLVASVPGAGQSGARQAPLDLIVLDGAGGGETGRLSLAPLTPHFNSTFSFRSLSLLPDGSGAALGADDGRAWAVAIDQQGVPSIRWQSDLGTPLPTGGMMLHCSIGWAAAAPEGFFFLVDRNWARFGDAGQGPQVLDAHPEAQSLHAFSAAAGNSPQRLWRYEVGARPQGLWLSPDRHWLGLAYGRPASTDPSGGPTPPDYGVAVLDLKRPGSGGQKLVYRYATEGPLSFEGRFSPDGRYLVVVEGPRPGVDRMSATRTYRVLVLH